MRGRSHSAEDRKLRLQDGCAQRSSGKPSFYRHVTQPSLHPFAATPCRRPLAREGHVALRDQSREARIPGGRGLAEGSRVAVKEEHGGVQGVPMLLLQVVLLLR
jgi:hypothetical protein